MKLLLWRFLRLFLQFPWCIMMVLYVCSWRFETGPSQCVCLLTYHHLTHWLKFWDLNSKSQPRNQLQGSPRLHGGQHHGITPSPFTPSPSPFTNPSQFKLQCLDLNLALQCHAALHRSKNWFRSSMSTRWTGLEILWRWDVSFAFWFFLETSTKVESRKCKTSVKLQSFVV